LTASPAARASSWLLHVTGDGESYVEHQNADVQVHVWEPPPDATNSVTLPAVSSGLAIMNDDTATAHADLTATVTGTWQGTDPAPTSIVLYVTSTAFACDQSSDELGPTPKVAGTADDGLGQNDPPNPSTGVASGSKYYLNVPVSGNTFTYPITLKGQATGTAGSWWVDGDGDLQPGSGDCSAGIGEVKVSIHAQPYNWHISSSQADYCGEINPNVPIGPYPGGLYFQYAWSSTSGTITDLTDCYSHERVTYPGSSDPYVPPAPYTDSYKNPTVLPGTGTNGVQMSSHTGQDEQFVWSTAPPYSTTPPITATQRYEFDDVATGQSNVLVPGPDSNPTIVRTVAMRPPYTGWWYSCTKSGITGWLQLP
jgi:hypothetical protein